MSTLPTVMTVAASESGLPLSGVLTTTICTPGWSRLAGSWVRLADTPTTICPGCTVWPCARSEPVSMEPRLRSVAARMPTALERSWAETGCSAGSPAIRATTRSSSVITCPQGTSRASASTATRWPVLL
ncbi:hypothetical protein KAURM247S_06496 [Kitasatospora aureofaciens]